MADDPTPVEESTEPVADPSQGGADHAPPGEDDSLAAHEASYGPKKDGPREPVVPRILKRHRAAKDEAGPADAPRIKELTRKLKEQGEELARLKTAPPAPVAPPLEPVAGERKPAARGPLPAGLRAKPTEDEVGTTYDSYGDYVEDLNDWKDELRQATARETATAEQAKVSQAKQLEKMQAAHASYTTRAGEYAKTHPEFPAKVAKLGTLKLGPLAMALMSLDNGPALVDTLVSTPYLAIEASNFWGDKPTSEEFVALATQWLTSRVQPGATGAGAAVSEQSEAPTPPTPVRTGLMVPGDRAPGDDASIRDHERAYYPNGPQRRRR